MDNLPAILPATLLHSEKLPIGPQPSKAKNKPFFYHVELLGSSQPLIYLSPKGHP